MSRDRIPMAEWDENGKRIKKERREFDNVDYQNARALPEGSSKKDYNKAFNSRTKELKESESHHWGKGK